MPFVIDQKPFYKWKVEVRVNKDGEVSTEIFTAHFKNISQSRFREMVKMVEEKQIDEIDVTKEVLIGWEDMEATDGSEVPFNKSTLNKLLEVRGFATAVGVYFMQSNEEIYKKKLIQAGEYWAVGSTVIDKTAEDDAVLGIKLEKKEVDNNFYVLEDNWQYLEMFLRCQTQWRVGMSGINGLDYTSVIEMIKLYSKDSIAMLENIQIIEAAALQALNRDK